MAVLSREAIQAKLKEMQDWSHAGKAIQKKFTFRSFMPAIGFVNKVAEAAEKAGHHPDTTVNFNVVIITLSTHSEGGVTEKDFELAQQLDRIAETIS